MRHLRALLQGWKPEQRYLQRTGQGVAIAAQHRPPKYCQARLVTQKSTPVDSQPELQHSRYQRSSSMPSRRTVNETLETHRSEIQHLVQQLLARKDPLIVHDARGEVHLFYRQFWNRTGILDVQWVTTSGLAHRTTTVLRGRSSSRPNMIAWHLARFTADSHRRWGNH